MKDKRNDSVEFGILLVGIGVIWLLFRMNILDFSFIRGLRVLWPGIFIVIGLSIIFSNVRGASTVIWFIFIVMILGYGNFYTIDALEDNVGWINFDVNISDWDYEGMESGVIKMDDYSKGKLNIDYPAGSITIEDGNEGLLEYTHPKNLVGMSISGTKQADVHMDIGQWQIDFDEIGKDYGMRYKLNNDIPWQIDIDTGAIDGYFDLSDIEVTDIDINTAAGDITVKMSDMADRASVTLNTAAADVDFEIPEDVGVRVEVDGLVKDVSFSDGKWSKRDGVHYSGNYDEADEIITIKVSLVAGDLHIERY